MARAERGREEGASEPPEERQEPPRTTLEIRGRFGVSQRGDVQASVRRLVVSLVGYVVLRFSVSSF